MENVKNLPILRAIARLIFVSSLGAIVCSGSLIVESSPGASLAVGSTVSVSTANPVPNVTTATANFTGPLPGDLELAVIFFRSTDNPAVASPIHHTSLQFYLDNNGAESYAAGGQLGDDNWVYVCEKVDDDLVYNGWAKVSLDQTSFTPLLYVWDPDNPTTLLTLPEAVAAATPNARDIQIKSVDFENFVIELHNYGIVSQTLTGWRFCTHDDNEFKKYSSNSGLNGVTIEAGTAVHIWFNNNAPVVDSDNINRSTIGGNWATPLDRGPWGMGLYFAPVSFGNGATIADHVQWSVGGVDNVSADERSDEAQSGGVWTNQSHWVATSPDTTKFILTDPSGGVLHSPLDYLVLPDFGITSFSYDEVTDEAVFTWPTVNNLEVTVEKSTTLLSGSWGSAGSSTGPGVTLTGESDPAAFYRLSVPLP